MPRNSTKLFKVTMHAPADQLHELMSMQEMKHVQIVDVQAITHGGIDEGGAMRPVPTGKEFVMAFAQSRDQFRPQDAYEDAERIGITRGSVSQAVVKLYDAGLLKRIATGTYTLAAKQSKKGGANETRGTGIRDAILTIIRGKQNGDGHGVPIQVIKEELIKRGYKAASVGTTLSQMMKKKKLQRPEPEHYRVEA